MPEAATTWEYRVDRMQTHLEAPVRGPGGAILATALAAGPGIYEYGNPDGTVRRELVTRDMLFHTDSALSLGRAPLTLLHPDEDDYPEGVTPENAGSLVVGDLDGEIIEGPGGYVKIRLAARRKDAQDAALSGDAVEISPGYNAEMDWTPGVHPEFGSYDGTQVSRRYNHVALVPKARGGSEMRVRMDSADTPVAVMRHTFQLSREDAMDPEDKSKADAPETHDAPDEKPETEDEAPEEKDDAKPTFDMVAVSKAVDAAVKNALDAYHKGQEDAKESAKAEDAEEDKPEKKADAADGPTLATLMAFHKERTRLDGLAASYGVEAKDDMTNAELAKAVVEVAKPDFRADSADHYTVAARLLDEAPNSTLFVRTPQGNRADAADAYDDGPIYGSNGVLAKPPTSKE